MSEKKDFLDSLVDETEKPESFQQENAVKIEKKPFKFNPKIVIPAVVGVVVLAVVGYFMFFAPNITMPNFVGQTTADVQSWIVQYGVSKNNVVVKEEYNFEYDSGVIVEQSVAEGKKVTKDVKLNLTVSKGADPDEKVNFPDIMSMTLDEIKEWRDTNKLQNVKINEVYNSAVEKGDVISYELKNVSEDNFTRGTSVTIQVSRGVEPAKSVTVTDYTGKTYAEFETWATNNKITINKVDSFTSDAEKNGKIASQNPSSGTVEQGSTITVTVYKQATKMTSLVGMAKADAEAWCSANGVNCQIVEQYHDTVLPNRIISQSVSANSVVENTTPVMLYMSIGRVDMMTFTGQTISELRTWVEDKNSKLAGLNLYEHYIVDDTKQSGLIKEVVYPIDSNHYGYLKYGDVIEVTYYVNSKYIPQDATPAE